MLCDAVLRLVYLDPIVNGGDFACAQVLFFLDLALDCHGHGDHEHCLDDLHLTKHLGKVYDLHLCWSAPPIPARKMLASPPTRRSSLTLTRRVSAQ